MANKIFDEILKKWTDGELTDAEANQKLKAAGANFYVDSAKATDGWTEEEMKAGFLPADPNEKKEVLRFDNMPQRKDLAGMTVIQTIMGLHYYVTYNEKGRAEKFVKVNRD